MRVLLSAVLLVASTGALAQGASRGQMLFLQCRACHTLKAGEPHKIGPNLHRMFTRPPLAATGFAYSPAFVSARPKWTPTLLDKWLERPGAQFKGTTMAFGGMAKPLDRAELITWLQANTR